MKKKYYFLLALALTACGRKPEKIHPAEEPITESVYASGIVKSRDQYEVYASAGGVTSQVFVTEGDTVNAGQPLLLITNTSARLNVENASIAASYSAVAANIEKLNELKESVDLAKLRVENDRSLFQRQQNLWQQQIGTRNDLEQRELAYKSSVNALETAQLSYRVLEKQIGFQAQQSQKNLQLSKTASGDYSVLSKINGKVYSVLKKKGEMVSMTTPVAIIGDAHNFYLELQVDEYDIARIKPGQKLLFSMDSYKGTVFDGVISKIDPLMNSRSKTFTVEATLIHPPPTLYPNLTCEANIVIQEKGKVLTIPRSALLEGDSVLLENKVKRKLLTGLKDYEKVEVLQGLTAKDIILKPAL